MEVLYLGSRGPMVYLLQSVLSELGYDPGAVDGIFGTRTEAALLAYQKAANLRQSGVTWPSTWDSLKDFLLLHPVWTNIPYSSNVLNINLHGFSRRFPFLRIDSIGTSPLGEPIHRIRIGEGTPAMYNASHHANEWITTPVLMKFVEDAAKAFDSGDSVGGYPARELFSRCELTVIPMVNPDGVDLVTGQIKQGSGIYNAAASMNYPVVPFPSGWKANIRGTDLNLNYPAGWEEAKRLKYAAGYVAPGPRDYVGPFPLSEPETSAMARLTRANPYALTISYHTQGREIYYTYLGRAPEGAEALGRIFSNVSGYTLTEPAEFSSYAGYKDWFIDEFNRPGYTVECGLGQNPLPLSQFDGIYAENVGILATGVEFTGSLPR